ncbi:MAG: histidinol phosphatase [Actinobacteria bacterium]|nr:histidinol phosphatase [Actinomycetota bacterium]
MNKISSREFDLADDLNLAIELADIADAISLARYQALDLVIETKPDLTPVTDADKAVESAIRSELARRRPNDLIVGEEFGRPDLDGDNYYWVIDPIDGTKNYLRGVPAWATLIGLVNPANEVVAGVVSAPALGRRWHAALGSGAFVKFNNESKKISVSKVAKLSDASLAYSDLVGWGNKRSAFIDLQEHVWRTRGHGDFWAHMLVAEGAVDISVEPTLALWDMAALDIIVREAGGTFTDLSGKPGPHGAGAISSNGKLLAEFITAIAGK